MYNPKALAAGQDSLKTWGLFDYDRKTVKLVSLLVNIVGKSRRGTGFDEYFYSPPSKEQIPKELHTVAQPPNRNPQYLHMGKTTLSMTYYFKQRTAWHGWTPPKPPPSAFLS